MADDSPKTPNASAGKEPISGPVPMRHNMRLGKGDGVHNPQSAGDPSKVPTINNGGKKGW